MQQQQSSIICYACGVVIDMAVMQKRVSVNRKYCLQLKRIYTAILLYIHIEWFYLLFRYEDFLCYL